MRELKKYELQVVSGGCTLISGGYMIFMSKSDFSKYFHVENELLVDSKQKIMLEGREISCYARISIEHLNDRNYLQNYLYNMYDLDKVQAMLLRSSN